MYPAFGVLGGIGTPEIVIVLFVLGALEIPMIFYAATLQRALDRCAVESRTLSPGLVWLLLIPLFSIIWHFIVVDGLSKSLHNEFVRRSVPAVEPEPGKGLGLATCIFSATSLIPILGIFCWLGSVVCWVIYWIKISGYSTLLERRPV